MTCGYQGKIIEEIEEVTEPKIIKKYKFEENDATVLMKYNGIEIKEFSTYSDYYGENSCIKPSIQEAEDIAKRYDINENSEGTIEVKYIKYNVIKVKTGRKNYLTKEDQYENVGIPKIIEEKIIWDTKNGHIVTKEN